MPSSTTTARRQAVRDFKRAAILEAARRVFSAHGLEGATVRAIAAEAGYTAGAIYAYYGAKEEIYGDILADTLAALGRAVKRAAADEREPRARLALILRAVHDFYATEPRAFTLGLHLHLTGGALPIELERQLNGRLIAVLKVIADALGEAGVLSAEEANHETIAAFAHINGILLLQATGRLAVLGFRPGDLVEAYLDRLTARLDAPA